ncbi:hypothetical protein OEZ86_000327 [Tetradesmus obliquus]|nr:hypothetical protein OEZ86_000327 [Tetradesmus obliquus]
MRIKLGHEAVDHCLEEHQKLKDGLAALTAASVSDPNFDGMVQEYMQELVKHMHEEEDDLLPRFAAAEGVTSDYLMQLGRVFETSKLLVPSRPHPWAPNKPPLNIITNSACVPLDFLRDLVRFEGAPPL